jgi:predicted nucleic-acid-binding Zn-ribbon protein
MFEQESEKVEILGKEFNCQICRHNEFWRREAQLNTAVATFFDFDWANESAICLVCANCGYIHWFISQ